MPNNIISSFAEKSGKSKEEVERLWDETKQKLIDNGAKESADNFYPILVSILKKKLNIND